jgi:hypothetical protein
MAAIRLVRLLGRLLHLPQRRQHAICLGLAHELRRFKMNGSPEKRNIKDQNTPMVEVLRQFLRFRVHTLWAARRVQEHRGR